MKKNKHIRQGRNHGRVTVDLADGSVVTFYVHMVAGTWGGQYPVITWTDPKPSKVNHVPSN